ncbi:hypothetical protein F4808DRAFT_426306 [Astrocystis sublimbata]|nr:hypothetical protein F4808DRAFT_426306 [Astrocystis sublimbata]
MPIAGPGITGPGFFQPPPPGMVQPSFPPPSWQAPFSGPMPPHLPPHLPPPPAPVDHHYAPRDLAMRFRRPSSSMGFRQASNPYEYEASPDRSMSRRQSISRKPPKDTKDHEDRKRMPPPPRPKSTRPERLDRLERMERPERQERPERIVLRAQAPPATHRKSVVFDDDDQDDESILYHDPHQKAHQNALRNAQNMLRRGSGVEYGSSPFKNARRQSFDAPESVFDFEDDEEDDEGDYYYEDELPPPPPRPRSRSRRRSSQVGIEDKIRDAARYQDHMVGGPSPALTAEALRKVKTGGSSRSTRSSASRDESEYKHSATTHTTRSSSGEDDITIKVSAGCVVEVGNVKIHSQDGGAVSIGRNGTSHGGSDRGTSIYGDDRLLRDDRRSRSDRSSTRMRANSQAAYARGLPAPGSYTPSPLYSRYDYDDDSSY